jgi:hypothetical protein
MKIISPLFTQNKHCCFPLQETLNKYSPQNKNDLIFYTDGTTTADFYHTKMFHASQTMKQLNDEIIVLVDAFDVLVNKSLDNLVEDFKNKTANY